MTVNEVLKRVIPVLEGIRVPMTEIPTIGIPISGAINDLKQCVAFMDRVEQEQAARKAAEEEARKAAEQAEAEREEMNLEEKEEEEKNDERPDV